MSTKEIIILLTGLGNPDLEHLKNRHNIGFMVVDEIAGQYGFPAFKEKFGVSFSKAQIDLPVKQANDENVEKITLILAKPQKYMNLSGLPVKQIRDFFKIKNENIYVFHDELDLKFAQIRQKRGGGSAGHNGLKDLDKHIGNDYHRVRVGIGHPGEKAEVSNYVLQDFSKEELSKVEELTREIAKNLGDYVK